MPGTSPGVTNPLRCGLRNGSAGAERGNLGRNGQPRRGQPRRGGGGRVNLGAGQEGCGPGGSSTWVRARRQPSQGKSSPTWVRARRQPNLGADRCRMGAKNRCRGTREVWRRSIGQHARGSVRKQDGGQGQLCAPSTRRAAPRATSCSATAEPSGIGSRRRHGRDRGGSRCLCPRVGRPWHRSGEGGDAWVRGGGGRVEYLRVHAVALSPSELRGIVRGPAHVRRWPSAPPGSSERCRGTRHAVCSAAVEADHLGSAPMTARRLVPGARCAAAHVGQQRAFCAWREGQA